MHMQLLTLLPLHFLLSQTCNLSPSFPSLAPSSPSPCAAWLLQTFDLAAF